MDNAVWSFDLVRMFIATVGMIFGLLELHDAFVDREVLKRSLLNGPRLLVANANIGNEALRLVIQVIFFVVAVQSVGWPMAIVGRPSVWRVFTGRILFMIATVCLTAKSWLDRRTRERLLHYWQSEASLHGRRRTDV